MNAASTPEYLGNGATCADGLDNDLDGQLDASDQGCIDTDGDTSPDFVDNCPSVSNHSWWDRDEDGIGDACDPTPLPPNDPPTVSAGGPYTVNEGASITLSASGSDPEGGALDYVWDLDGDGTFGLPGQEVTFSAADIQGPQTITIAVQAIDGDGKRDLAVPNYTNNGTISLLLGNGDGTFQSAQSDTVDSFPAALAVGELNGDNKPDLVAANSGNSSVSVLLNQSTSVPTATPTATPTSTATPTATPSGEPTSTATPTTMPTSTPTANPSATPSATVTPTNTPTPTMAPTATPTATPGSSTRIKDMTFEGGSLTGTQGADSQSGTVNLETGAPLKGNYSARVPNVTSGYLSENFTAPDELFTSFYIKRNAAPASSARIAQISNSGTTVGNLVVNSSGTLQLRNGSTTIGSASAPLTVGTIYRVGIHQKKGTGGNAVLEVYLATGDAAFGAPFASSTSQTFTSQATRFSFGATNGNAIDATFDDIRLDTAAMPAP